MLPSQTKMDWNDEESSIDGRAQLSQALNSNSSSDDIVVNALANTSTLTESKIDNRNEEDRYSVDMKMDDAEFYERFGPGGRNSVRRNAASLSRSPSRKPVAATSKASPVRQSIENKMFNIGQQEADDEDNSLDNFFESEELNEKIGQEQSVPVSFFNAEPEEDPVVPNIRERTPSPPVIPNIRKKERTPSPPTPEVRQQQGSPQSLRSPQLDAARKVRGATVLSDAGSEIEIQSNLPSEEEKKEEPSSTQEKPFPEARRERAKRNTARRERAKQGKRKKNSSKGKKEANSLSLMITEDEDSIRSCTSGSSGSDYSDNDTSSWESARDRRSRSPDNKASDNLDRIGSMLSESDTEAYTDGDGTFTDAGTHTDGDTYDSGHFDDASTLGGDDEVTSVPSTTAMSRQRANESQLLTNSSKLFDIELGEHTLIRHSASDLAEAIKHNTHLQKLTLNQKDCDPLRFEILFEGIEVNKSVSQLELFQLKLTKETASELVSALSKNTTIRKLCLNRCKFVGSGLAILFMGLQHNKTIKHIGIESCRLGSDQADVVSAAIPMMQLQSIRVENARMTEKAMLFFLQCIDKTPTLESINISEQTISISNMEMLIESIHKSKTLVRLVLVDCGLDETCVEVLAEGFEKNEKIEEIDLSKNGFGDEGADMLIDLLKKNDKIKILKCNACRISRNEKRLLKDALRYNNTFLKKMFSAEVTLSILDSVGLIQQNVSSN